jgi:hypothetical protein
MKENFTTSDVYLAAILLALGALYDGADKDDPRHMIFRFSSEKLEFAEVERGWINKTLSVNAWDYAEAIKKMKSIIHAR